MELCVNEYLHSISPIHLLSYHNSFDMETPRTVEDLSPIVGDPAFISESLSPPSYSTSICRPVWPSYAQAFGLSSRGLSEQC